MEDAVGKEITTAVRDCRHCRIELMDMMAMLEAIRRQASKSAPLER